MVTEIRRTAGLLLTALLLAPIVSAQDEATSSDAAPDFVLKSTAGPNLRLSEYRGEVVMLSFWASWCGECRSQLEAIEDLHAAYEDIGLQILSVSLDPKISQARETAASLNVSFPVLHDTGGEVGELYDVDDVPLVVFVDREGRVRELVEGYSRAEEQTLADRLRALLRE